MSKATIIDTGEKRWSEKSITLPVCLDWKDFFFHTAGGTDQLILEIHDCDNEQIFAESLYSNDWKNNTLKEIVINGIRNSVHEDRAINLFTAFSENLVSLSPAEKRRYI
ncbi:hypothetical protein MKW98_021095 [Papaver atlanticum]|uniref:Uncharacterized protein n=1 Tax=Papaver atlanticum TaxID=357466 RepID=A0AAD4XSS9_9MAGN|nr:hypothetical protein MKW98_021095 [Papaver atlanticum]